MSTETAPSVFDLAVRVGRLEGQIANLRKRLRMRPGIQSYFNVQQAAEYLGRSSYYVRRLIKDGYLVRYNLPNAKWPVLRRKDLDHLVEPEES